MKKTTCLLALICLVGTLGFGLGAEEEIEYPVLDQEALKSMSKAERREAQQAYKAELEAIAKTHGWSREQGLKAFGPPSERRQAPEKGVRIPGTMITYHSGAVVGAPAAGVSNSMAAGNRYDTALNPAGTICCFPAEVSGSITMLTFSMVSVGGTAAFVSIFDQVAGTTANVVTSFSQAGLAPGLNTVTPAVAINYVGSSFIAGIWNFNTDVPGMATGTVGGQGFHGISINDVVATGLTTVANHNAVMTVQGDVATPVELKTFTID